MSLPREHGAYLTLLGAAVAAVLVAPRPLAAFGASALFASAFLVRGVVERGAVGAPLRAWDRAFALACVAAALAGERLAARGAPELALGLAALAVAGLAAAAIARRWRMQRELAVELMSLGALGASAGLAALAGGADVTTAALVGGVLGAHAAASVPVVRAAVRNQRPPGTVIVAVVVLAVAAACVTVGRAPLALALAPRLVQLGAARRARRHRIAPRAVGLRETILLGIVIAVVVLAR